MRDKPVENFPAYDPKLLGHRTIKNTPSVTPSSTPSTILLPDGSVSTTTPPAGETTTTIKKPSNTTTTEVHEKPPYNPEDPGCREPPDWYDKFGEYFCDQK